MAPDCMAVRLHLRRMRVVEVKVDEPDRLEVVVADVRTVVRCPACGYRTKTVHETRPTRVRDLPGRGQRTTLIWLRRRFECTNCGTRHTEDHPEIEGRLTRRLARQHHRRPGDDHPGAGPPTPPRLGHDHGPGTGLVGPRG